MPEPENDAEFNFKGDLDDFPEDWLDVDRGGAPRLRRDRKAYVPEPLTVDASGAIGSTGRRAWFIPGKFRFCPACKDQPAGRAREINKLAGLSAEGRSSATTLLVSSAVRWMNWHADALPPHSRKLLGFTDNRQDAALQAGHFNDFLFVALLRGAILAAVRKAGEAGLSEQDFGRSVQAALGFTAVNRERRQEWMLDPEAKGVPQVNAEQALSRVLAYRVWADQRRGWRFTNPNLEELDLVKAEYLSLDELAEDDDAFAAAPPELRNAKPETRKNALSVLLQHLRHGLAVTADALERSNVESTSIAARQSLRDPWAIGAQEQPRLASALIVDAPHRQEVRLHGEQLLVRGGPRSRLARELGHRRIWGTRLKSATYLEIVAALLKATRDYGLVRSVATPLRRRRLAARRQRLSPRPRRAQARSTSILSTSTPHSPMHSKAAAKRYSASKAASTLRRSTPSGANGANGGSVGARRIAPSSLRKRRICARPLSPRCSCRCFSARRPWNSVSIFPRSMPSTCATCRRHQRTMPSAPAVPAVRARRRWC